MNGGEDGGVWILLFSEVTLFENNNFVGDRSLVFNLLKCYRHKEIISPLSEAFYYRLFLVQQILFTDSCNYGYCLFFKVNYVKFSAFVQMGRFCCGVL